MKIKNKSKVEQPKVEQPKQEQPKVEQPKVEQPDWKTEALDEFKVEQPKVEQSVEDQKLEKQAKELREDTWLEVQEVAQGEITSNGKMLYIFRNFLRLYEMEKLELKNYFSENTNLDRSEILKKILFDLDGNRRTLIAKDFSVFCDKVLIGGLGQNVTNFQKENPYIYKTLQQLAPAVLFGLANRHHLDLDNMLIEPDIASIPVEICLPWAIFDSSIETNKNEAIFKSNLASRLFNDSERKKPWHKTFRGDRGLEEISKMFFLPKKVVADNVENAEVSAFAKELKVINDMDKGALGKATAITTAKENTQGSVRRDKEIDELYFTAEKAISLLSTSDCPYARQTLIVLYCDMLDVLNSVEFKEQIKVISQSKAKVEFDPQVNGNSFDIRGGDFFKHIKEVANL